jgi:hypothetical protein
VFSWFVLETITPIMVDDGRERGAVGGGAQ